MDILTIIAKETSFGVSTDIENDELYFVEIENILNPKSYIKRFIEKNIDLLKNKKINIKISPKTTFTEKTFFIELNKELKKRNFDVFMYEEISRK